MTMHQKPFDIWTFSMPSEVSGRMYIYRLNVASVGFLSFVGFFSMGHGSSNEAGQIHEDAKIAANKC
jgi:hypothetical protein